ncbi:hypothetical protein [Pollutimonas bauzanensis]|uniref:hypothetical protein n=1 Tax=Pollutimonas bauzanensis TaxID=658167 RepID=UPI003340A632
MNTVKLFSATLAAVLFQLSGVTMAAPPSSEAPTPMPGAAPFMRTEAPTDSSAPMQHISRGGMMDGGMMGMMRGCPMMGLLGEPNGKVMMQMHGEMMRAMGDILMKYADKFETPPAPQ